MVRAAAHYCRHATISFAVLITLLVLSGCKGITITRLWRQGAIATAAPIATDIGLQVLRNGGNAFDAAVAVGFVLSVVYPEAGNIGGGGFALIRNGATGDIRSLDFRETAPSAGSETMYLDEQGEVIEGLSTKGALAAGVPGTVAGLFELWEQHGSMPWQELVLLAVILADTGFIVDDYLSRSLSESRRELDSYESASAIYFPDGAIPQVGDRLIQPDLAATLFAISAEGRDGFYTGEIAKKIETSCLKHGGIITADDLGSYRAIWREPIHFKFDGYDIYSMPPPSSGGLMMGQILKLIEPLDRQSIEPGTAKYIHLFCEASKLAFADRSEHLGDPDFHKLPNMLLDGIYLDERRQLIDIAKATQSIEIAPGQSPPGESEQTTHYSICDSDGNMVAVTYTLNSSYGSKLMVEGAGFLLNNEMDDFSIKPGFANIYGLIGGQANAIAPDKRMLSSMSPTLVLQQGEPFLALGSRGGSKIITTVAQALSELLCYGSTLEETVSRPRFHHQWLPDSLFLEENKFNDDLLRKLTYRGYDIRERTSWGDLQVVMIENGLFTAASDPRGGGVADGL